MYHVLMFSVVKSLHYVLAVGSTLTGAHPQQVLVQTQVPPPPPHAMPHLGHPHLIQTNPPPATSPPPMMTTVQPELVPASVPLWGSPSPAGIPAQQIIQQVSVGWNSDLCNGHLLETS
jgi:hypothetical protein